MKKLDKKISHVAKMRMNSKKLNSNETPDNNDPLPPLTWRDYYANVNGELPDILANSIKRKNK